MTIFNARQPLKLTPRADFRPEQFRKVIFSHGMSIKWEQASECPCSAPSSDYAFSPSIAPAGANGSRTRHDCGACGGKGYIWHSAQEIKGVVTGARQTPNRFSEAVGGLELSRGQIGVTLLPEHLPALGDKLTLLDSALVFRETVTRGAGLIDALKYPVFEREHDLSGGVSTLGVRYCIVSDAQGVVDPASTKTQGVDFNLSAGGGIEWEPASAPAQGIEYSVSYYAHPVYVVLDHPHVIRDTQRAFKAPAPYHAELPVYAEAQLEFFGSD